VAPPCRCQSRFGQQDCAEEAAQGEHRCAAAAAAKSAAIAQAQLDTQGAEAARHQAAEQLQATRAAAAEAAQRLDSTMSAQAAAEGSLAKRQQELAQVAMELNEARREKEGIEQLARELAATCGEAPCTAAARAPTASAPTASAPAAAATASWPGAGLGPAAVEPEAEDLRMGAAVRDAEALLAGGLYKAC
jgi:hypothetical protein